MLVNVTVNITVKIQKIIVRVQKINVKLRVRVQKENVNITARVQKENVKQEYKMLL